MTPAFSRFAAAGAALLLLALPRYAQAQATASGAIDLNSISISSSAGSISWSGDWNINAISSSDNSLGELDFGTDFGETTSASTGSAVTYANGDASASASGASSVTGHVDGTVSLPASFTGLEAEVGAIGNNVTLETQFSLDGVTSANVTFAAAIDSDLTGSTGPDGQVLHDENIFNFQVDGSPTLSFDDNRTLGPNQTFSDLQSPALSDAVMGFGGGSHDLFIELDSEQEAVTAPETPSPLVGLEAAGLLFALGRRWRSRKSS